MTLRQTAGNVIAVALAILWTIASQAHFTDKLTPDMSKGINKDVKGIHPAFKYTGFSQEQIKYGFGSLGLLTAYLLARRSTRILGLMMAIGVTIFGRIYPQMTVKSLGGENLVAPVVSLLVAAFSLGLLS